MATQVLQVLHQGLQFLTNQKVTATTVYLLLYVIDSYIIYTCTYPHKIHSLGQEQRKKDKGEKWLDTETVISASQ